MSAKVFLLNEAGLKPEKVKRSFAKKLVLKLLAVKLDDFRYQRVIVRKAAEYSAQQHIPAKPYIPETLPSHKVPGTKAIGPVAEQSANCVATIRLANQMAHA